MTRCKEREAPRHRCEEPRCVEIAVDKYQGKWRCGRHLNPDLPQLRVEDRVLVRSNWIGCDELE